MTRPWESEGAQLRSLLDRVLPAGVARDDGADAERIARIVWSIIAEPGDGVVGRLVDDLGARASLEAVWDDKGGPAIAGRELRQAAHLAQERVLRAYRGRGFDEAPDGVAAGFARWRPRMGPAASVQAVLEMARASDALLLTPDDEGWPLQLADLGEHSPLLLWARGDAGLLTRAPMIAVVGARAATAYGTHVATDLAAELCEHGYTVVSGAAYGIDAAAHRAALAASGGTVAVLAGGADRFYPSGNDDLLRRIVRHGLVVAEVPFDSPPTRWRFLQRNRVIAALAQATVVVEAGERSGTINTAGHAGKLGRPLGAVPGPVTSPSSAGCHRLMREYGAECVTGCADVLRLVGGLDAAAEPLADPEDPRYMRALDALSARSPRPLDEVARRSGMAAPEVASLLGTLLLDGRVRKTERGWVSVPRRS
ncbi:DNA-processing protein DprA [Gryllotalpicola ginsengisoli]|uniref:DNA-processing protein DprA n=1 Tax=Gryllotalpicola ginsengisoli TaxID=444608 RepID=UPI0003F6FECB|nr:DNA-processing protein DprA [Gryllotalpicola ginsengisoli]